ALRPGPPLEDKHPLLRSDGDNTPTWHCSSARDRRQERDKISRRQQKVELTPRTELVVHKNIDMWPRLAPLVAQADVNLRMPPGKLRQNVADILPGQLQFRVAAAKRPQLIRNRDPNALDRRCHPPDNIANPGAGPRSCQYGEGSDGESFSIHTRRSIGRICRNACRCAWCAN